MWQISSIPKKISYERTDNEDIKANPHIFNIMSIYHLFPNLSKNSTLTNFVIYHEWINVLIQIAYNRCKGNTKFEVLSRICVPVVLGKSKFAFQVLDEIDAQQIDKDQLLTHAEVAFNKHSRKFYYNQIKHLEKCNFLTIDYNKEMLRMINIITVSQKNIDFENSQPTKL